MIFVLATTTFLLQISTRYVHFALVFPFVALCCLLASFLSFWASRLRLCVVCLVFVGFLGFFEGVFDNFWLGFVSFLDCCV